MGCNCGNKGKATQYQYVPPQGAAQTYRTEIEAQAARIRNGNTGTVRPVK
jgi:hypothetical protein